MLTKNAALASCVELLESLLATTTNDLAETIATTAQQARDAIAIPFQCPKLSIMGPEGITLHPYSYESLDELVKAAANFPLRFLHQGYYAGIRDRIAITDLPNHISVIVDEDDEEYDEDEYDRLDDDGPESITD